jgi:ABC-type Fe3+-hydroxamate transport system substrate-binding protein
VIRTTDARGREILLARPPRRIVSLVPSDTYSLVALGVAERIVGRTRYCVEPAGVVSGIEALGGTKNPDVEAIIQRFPDLVVANQEENTQRDLERIAQAGIAVYVSFPKRVWEGLAHLARLAQLLDVADDAAVKDLLRGHYDTLQRAEAWRRGITPVRAFCPIWMEPLMTVNADTFMSDALDLAGAENVFAARQRRYPLAADLGRGKPLSAEETAGRDTRYPRVTWEEIVERAPELVVLPDEPHEFSEADAERFSALDVPAAKRGAIVFANGKDFSWYGARGLEGIERVRALVAEHVSR